MDDKRGDQFTCQIDGEIELDISHGTEFTITLKKQSGSIDRELKC